MTRYHIMLACAILAAVCSVVCAAPHLEMTTPSRRTASTSLGPSTKQEVSGGESRSTGASPATVQEFIISTRTSALGGGYMNTADSFDAETSRTSGISQRFVSSPPETLNDSSIASTKAGIYNQSNLATDLVDTPLVIPSPNLIRRKNNWKGGPIIRADDRKASDRDKSVLQNLDGLPGCIARCFISEAPEFAGNTFLYGWPSTLPPLHEMSLNDFCKGWVGSTYWVKWNAMACSHKNCYKKERSDWLYKACPGRTKGDMHQLSRLADQ